MNAKYKPLALVDVGILSSGTDFKDFNKANFIRYFFQVQVLNKF